MPRKLWQLELALTPQEHLLTAFLDELLAFDLVQIQRLLREGVRLGLQQLGLPHDHEPGLEHNLLVGILGVGEEEVALSDLRVLLAFDWQVHLRNHR